MSLFRPRRDGGSDSARDDLGEPLSDDEDEEDEEPRLDGRQTTGSGIVTQSSEVATERRGGRQTTGSGIVFSSREAQETDRYRRFGAQDSRSTGVATGSTETQSSLKELRKSGLERLVYNQTGFETEQGDGGYNLGGALDNVAETTVDTTLDNDIFSVQEATQAGMVQAYRLSSGRDDADDEDVAGAFQGAIGGIREGATETVEGTPLDNPATGVAGKAFDALVGQPTSTVFGSLTGVDVESGGTEYEPSAVEAGEIALIAGTGGLGQAARGGGSLTARLGLRGGDEAAQTAAGVSDEATQLIRGGADEATQAADDVATRANPLDSFNVDEATDVSFRSVTGSDEAAAGADDALPALDDAGSAADEIGERSTRLIDDAGTTADDAADESGSAFGSLLDDVGERSTDVDGVRRAGPTSTSRFVDDAGSAADDIGSRSTRLLDDAGTTADDAATTTTRVADDAATTATRTGDDSGGLISRLRGGADDAGTTATRTADDAATTATRTGDDSGGIISRLRGGTDDAGTTVTRTADDVASGADESANLFTRVTGVRPRTAGLAGGTFLAGGAAATLLTGGSPEDAPDEFEADVEGKGYLFQQVQTLEPVEEFPNGGQLYTVTRDRQTVGYWVLLGVQGRNIILMDEERTTRRAKISVEDFKKMVPGEGQGGNQ